MSLPVEMSAQENAPLRCEAVVYRCDVYLLSTSEGYGGECVVPEFIFRNAKHFLQWTFGISVMMNRAVNLMLDSGAFSAWKKRLHIDLDDYIAFIKHNEGCFDTIVNVDVIPGWAGKRPSEDQVEASAAKGWENLKELEKAGIDAMPVYHMGERRYWLERMIDEGCEYVGISPSNDRTTDQKREWLDEVYHFLCGDRGYPEIKTHGFGVTATSLVHRYPWFSVDSTTWLKLGANGGVQIPKPGKGDDDYDYTTSPESIAMSKRGTESVGRLFTSLGERERAYVTRYITDQGLDVEQLRGHHLPRQRLNCRFFQNVAKAYTRRPFSHPPTSLISVETREGVEEYRFGDFKMIPVVTTDAGHSDVLTDEGVWDRLWTFFDFREGQCQSIDLRKYVRTGRLRTGKNRGGASVLDGVFGSEP